MKQFNPYLTFNGDCEAAFNCYREIFGGEFLVFSRFGEVPEEDSFPMAEDERELVMHVSLPIGEQSVLMGSDTPSSMGESVFGSNFSISMDADSEAEAERLFNGLAESGKLTMPLGKTFWSDCFGMCVDRFGVQWMVGFDQPKDA